MSDEQILARGQEAVDNGCTEMHIVGGLHHQKGYDWYVNILRILHEIPTAPSQGVDGAWRSIGLSFSRRSRSVRFCSI